MGGKLLMRETQKLHYELVFFLLCLVRSTCALVRLCRRQITKSYFYFSYFFFRHRGCVDARRPGNDSQAEISHHRPDDGELSVVYGAPPGKVCKGDRHWRPVSLADCRPISQSGWSWGGGLEVLCTCLVLEQKSSKGSGDGSRSVESHHKHVVCSNSA